MSRTLICLLCAVFLGVFSGLRIACAAGDPGIETPAMDLLDRAQRKLTEGDSASARADLEAAVEQLTGTGRVEEIVAALVSLATLEQDEGRSRQAMNWWLRALPSADALAHATDSQHPDIGVYVRVQMAALLLASGDSIGSEQMGWDSLSEAVDLGRFDAAPVGVLAVLRVAAIEGEQGVRERAVELDELLAGFESYRLHPLPRPLPLAFMSHDVARQYAEAALFEQAEPAFATAARAYEALGAPDLASRATVDLGRAAMERGRLDVADAALIRAKQLDAAMAREAGADAVAAELLMRRGDVREAGERFAALAKDAREPLLRALYLGRAARLLGVQAPDEAPELHRAAAELLDGLGAAPEAVTERVLRAFQLARGAQWRAAGEAIGRVDAALAEEGAAPLAADVAGRLAVARALWMVGRGEIALARAALADAGGAWFRRGRSDEVAAVTARYVDLALRDGDAAAVDAALANVFDVEERLGLRVDGWRGLAAQARVAVAREEPQAAHEAYRAAAERVEWLGFAREVQREPAALGDPGDTVYGPWLELLLSVGRHDEAFAVLQRWRSWRDGGNTADPERRALQEQVRAVRESLRVISTRATKEDPTTLRAPLLDELARLRELMPSAPSCEADSVRAALPSDGGLLDGVQLDSGDWVFLIDAAGLEVRRTEGRALSRRDPLRRRIAKLRAVAHTGLPGWGAKNAVQRRLGGACDLHPAEAATPSTVLPIEEVPPPVSDVVAAALGAPVQAQRFDAGVLVLSATPLTPQRVARLQARGASAVVVADVDAERLTALLAGGKSLDGALAALRGRRGPVPEVWGPLP